MIELRDLEFEYNKDKKVLNNINLEIKNGLTSIVGPNAAGKSTLMKCIFGILDYKGDIFYNRKNLKEYKKEDLNDLFVYLPQEEGYVPKLTVLETVLLGKLQNLSWNVSDEEILEVLNVLKMLNIENLSTRYLTELSGGQRQMVYIAQTIIKNPEILMMDEPTNNLDIQKQLEFCKLLRLLLERKKMSVLLILHDLNLAINYSDNIIVLDGKGRVYDYGKPEDIITEKMLKDVYGVDSEIIKDSRGKPVVVLKDSIKEIKLM